MQGFYSLFTLFSYCTANVGCTLVQCTGHISSLIQVVGRKCSICLYFQFHVYRNVTSLAGCSAQASGEMQWWCWGCEGHPSAQLCSHHLSSICIMQTLHNPVLSYKRRFKKNKITLKPPPCPLGSAQAWACITLHKHTKGTHHCRSILCGYHRSVSKLSKERHDFNPLGLAL